MTDNKNTILAIVLSALVLLGWQYFFAVPQEKARQDVRVQTADWNRYRRKLADTAGMATESTSEGGKRASVRIDEDVDATDSENVGD